MIMDKKPAKELAKTIANSLTTLLTTKSLYEEYRRSGGRIRSFDKWAEKLAIEIRKQEEYGNDCIEVSDDESKIQLYIDLSSFPLASNVSLLLSTHGFISALHKFGKQVVNIVKNTGWFVLYGKFITSDYGTSYKLAITPIVGRVLPKEKLPKFLFHLTPKGNIASILEHGLRPSTSSKDRRYAPRTYLITRKGFISTAATALARYINLKRSDLALLSVDSKKIKGEVYTDPEIAGERAVYVEELIPADAILVVKSSYKLASNVNRLYILVGKILRQ